MRILEILTPDSLQLCSQAPLLRTHILSKLGLATALTG